MKEIKLTKGKVAIVDDEDYDWLMQWKWRINSIGYAMRTVKKNGKARTIFMHRVILNTPSDMCSDHANHNRLDNRRCNLRICTKQQNQANAPAPKNNRSGVKGVSWNGRDNMWMACISFYDKTIHLGAYKDINDAAQAYAQKARELFGEFAYTGD